MIYLSEKQMRYVLDCLNAKIKRIHNTLVNKNREDWGDYDEQQIIEKCRSHSEEYNMLYTSRQEIITESNKFKRREF